jgi:hypothetical protein
VISVVLAAGSPSAGDGRRGSGHRRGRPLSTLISLLELARYAVYFPA